MCRLQVEEHVLRSDGLYLAVVLQIFIEKQNILLTATWIILATEWQRCSRQLDAETFCCEENLTQ